MLLKAELDPLSAQELQEEKTTEVRADFAFVVIDPPVAADKIHSLRILISCTTVAILAPVRFAPGSLFYERIYKRAKAEQQPAGLEPYVQHLRMRKLEGAGGARERCGAVEASPRVVGKIASRLGASLQRRPVWSIAILSNNQVF